MQSPAAGLMASGRWSSSLWHWPGHVDAMVLQGELFCPTNPARQGGWVPVEALPLPNDVGRDGPTTDGPVPSGAVDLWRLPL